MRGKGGCGSRKQMSERKSERCRIGNGEKQVEMNSVKRRGREVIMPTCTST